MFLLQNGTVGSRFRSAVMMGPATCTTSSTGSWMTRLSLVLITAGITESLGSSLVQAFTSSSSSSHNSYYSSSTLLSSSTNDDKPQPPPQQQPVFLPTSPTALIRQAATAISTAFLDDGIHLQSIRLPLSEAMYGRSEEGFVADRAIGWRGGPQETYRYASPLVRQLLQSIQTLPGSIGGGTSGLSAMNLGNCLPPRIREQILLEFDGSALMASESPGGPLGDAQALLQPNTDSYYVDIIKTIQQQLPAARRRNTTTTNTTTTTAAAAINDDDTTGTDVSTNNNNNGDINDDTMHQRLFLLVNPAWRDASSFGIFDAKQAQRDILDPYQTTFAMDQFVVRGQKCTLLQVWPHDWCIFWSPLPYNKNSGDGDSDTDATAAEFLGSFPERPSYPVMDDLVRQAISTTRKN